MLSDKMSEKMRSDFKVKVCIFVPRMFTLSLQILVYTFSADSGISFLLTSSIQAMCISGFLGVHTMSKHNLNTFICKCDS